MTRSERLAWFIGETARPLAIVVTSIAASVATVLVAMRTEDGNDAAILMGAIFAGVGVLYGAKAWEAVKTKQSDNTVEVAKAEAKK
jgi:hypothetical protein